MPTKKTTAPTPAPKAKAEAAKATPAPKAKAEAAKAEAAKAEAAKAEALAKVEEIEQQEERIGRRAAHEIPEGMRFQVSHSSGKPIQKIGAASPSSPRARLIPELRRRAEAGQIALPGTHNGLAQDLAWARRMERTDLPKLTQADRAAWFKTQEGFAQAKSTRESIGRARDNGYIVQLDNGMLTLIVN